MPRCRTKGADVGCRATLPKRRDKESIGRAQLEEYAFFDLECLRYR